MNTRTIINKKRLGRYLNHQAELLGVTRASLPTLQQCHDKAEIAALDAVHSFISPFNPERPKKRRHSRKQPLLPAIAELDKTGQLAI